MMRLIRLVVLAVLALSGCGGGGGGGDSLRISMGRAPLTASYFPSELPAMLPAQAAVTGTASSDLYVFIEDAAGAFVPGQVPFGELDGDVYEASLTVRNTLPVGLHRGTLVVRICSDLACGTQLASASRPYEITIKVPELGDVPASLASGVLKDSSRLFLNLTLKGARSPIYVAAQDESGRFSGQTLQLVRSVSAPGPDRYTAALSWVAGLAEQSHSGNVTLKFCSQTPCTTPYLTRTLPYRVQVFGTVANSCCAYALAVDGEQNLYVASGERIDKVTPAGSISNLFTHDNQTPNVYPKAVAVGGDGMVYFSEKFSAGIDRLAPNGLIRRISNSPASDMSVGSDGYLYIINSDLGGPSKFSAEGEVQSWRPSFDLQGPSGVSVDSAGTVYVAEERGVVAVAQDTSTRFLAPLPTGQRPVDVVPAASGSVLVTTTSGLYRITSAGVVEPIVPGGTLITVNGFNTVFAPGNIVRTSGGRVYITDLSGPILFSSLP